MTLYVDPSALLRHYLQEADRDRFERELSADADWVLARHSAVEVRRNLVRQLELPDLSQAQRAFEDDWRKSRIVELDEATCDLACELAEATGARTLDALHLAAAQRFGGGTIPFLTADARQGRIARSLGWVVLGT